MKNYLIEVVAAMFSSLPTLIFILAVLYFTGQEVHKTEAFSSCGKECDRTIFTPCWDNPDASCVAAYKSCNDSCTIQLHK